MFQHLPDAAMVERPVFSHGRVWQGNELVLGLQEIWGNLIDQKAWMAMRHHTAVLYHSPYYSCLLCNECLHHIYIEIRGFSKQNILVEVTIYSDIPPIWVIEKPFRLNSKYCQSRLRGLGKRWLLNPISSIHGLVVNSAVTLAISCWLLHWVCHLIFF